jgi:uncharacterized protein
VPTRRSLVPLLVVAVLVAVAGSSTVVGSAGPALAAPGEPPSDVGVEVDGVGTATAVPDVLRFTVGVETAAGTVGEALAAAGAATRQVLEALRAQGVAEDDARTVDVALHPQFDRDGAEITGYVARQDLTVTVREIGRAGEVMAAAVGAGGDAARLQGLSYELEDDASVQAEARDEAFAAARRKAEQYAELSGRRLGEILWVREQVGRSGPVPLAAADAVATESVPIAVGAAEVAVTVVVRWSLR